MGIRRLEDKCNECMLCVQDCIAGVWRDIAGLPTVVDPELCNHCSHCLAVCPQSAIEHDALDAEQAQRIGKKLLDPEVYREIVISRRSVRQYQDRPVPREIIEDIISLARHSPTASNLQNVQYIVVTDKELIQKISRRIFAISNRILKWIQNRWGKIIYRTFARGDFARSLSRYLKVMDYYKEKAKEGRDYILHNAPVLILLHAPARSNFSCDNCNIAATNITNYSHALGLGTCYIGFLTMSLRLDRTLRRWVDVPKGRRVFASLVLGYPAYSYTFTGSRKEPKVRWIEGSSPSAGK
ncbi:MAG: nitroreductase family protein [Deltaproteobacteria bacterium]|nr:MAG: nitroreductase family protein [Deltaproteobacteria bacterium]